MSRRPPERLAFVGLGTMGRPMARNLTSSGYALRGFDLAADARAAAAREGVEVASSLEQALAGVDAVLLSLPTAAAVEAVLERVAEGVLVVDLSTIGSRATQRLAQATRERGVELVDAPVSKGPVAAESGDLTVMVGGSRDAVGCCMPLLERIGSRVVHVGPVGSGQAAKLANNALLAVIAGGIAEALVLGEALGAPVERLVDVIGHSSAGSWALDQYFPAALRGDYSGGATVELLHKDVRIALADGHDAQVPMALCATAAEVYDAVRERGYGALDLTAVLLLERELAGGESGR